MTKKTMYVVVKYPKEMSHASALDFNIYAKQNSDYDKMVEYGQEIASKHQSEKVLVMKRENAEQLSKIWHNYFRNYGRTKTFEAKKRSKKGHD